MGVWTLTHIPYKYHPCMVYLYVTFTINQPNVGKYTKHGWYRYVFLPGIVQNFSASTSLLFGCQVTLTTAVFGAANGVPVLAKLGWMYLNEPRKNLSI